MPRLLKIPEVSELLGLSDTATRRLIDSGQIVSCRVGPRGGSIRVREEDLQSYIASTRHRKSAPLDRRIPAAPVSALAMKHFPKLYGQRRA